MSENMEASISHETVLNLKKFFDSMTSDIITVRGIVYYTGLPEDEAEKVLQAIQELMDIHV